MEIDAYPMAKPPSPRAVSLHFHSYDEAGGELIPVFRKFFLYLAAGGNLRNYTQPKSLHFPQYF
jgi:hypothetical protein